MYEGCLSSVSRSPYAARGAYLPEHFSCRLTTGVLLLRLVTVKAPVWVGPRNIPRSLGELLLHKGKMMYDLQQISNVNIAQVS
jgi:hypothetical protein